MRKARLRIAAAALLFLAAGSAPGVRAQPARLTMTCHELLQGVPLKDPIVYQVVGPNLFRTGVTGERLIISTDHDPHYLSTVRFPHRVEQTYASHVMAGPILTRTVFTRREGGGPMRVSFTERYDFARQRYTSSFDPHDACHHEGRP